MDIQDCLYVIANQRGFSCWEDLCKQVQPSDIIQLKNKASELFAKCAGEVAGNSLPTILKLTDSDTRVVAIVLGKDWYNHHKPDMKSSFSNDFIVCQWHDYHDGEKSNLEAKQMLAVCRSYESAVLVYQSAGRMVRAKI